MVVVSLQQTQRLTINSSSTITTRSEHRQPKIRGLFLLSSAHVLGCSLIKIFLPAHDRIELISCNGLVSRLLDGSIRLMNVYTALHSGREQRNKGGVLRITARAVFVSAGTRWPRRGQSHKVLELMNIWWGLSAEREAARSLCSSWAIERDWEERSALFGSFTRPLVFAAADKQVWFRLFGVKLAHVWVVTLLQLIRWSRNCSFPPEGAVESSTTQTWTNQLNK